MRNTERLYDRVIEKMDMTCDMEDEELQELIHEVLEEASKEEFIPLQEKIRISKELFNAFRKLDILQELIEDDEITEIMINGTDHIFLENSIIGRDVVIGTGAVVKNCILFSGSVVNPGAHLENVIMDKTSKVQRQLNLKGDATTPLYIKEGDVV